MSAANIFNLDHYLAHANDNVIVILSSIDIMNSIMPMAHATASMKYIPHHEKKGSRKHIIDLHHKIQRNSWPLSILHWSDFKFKCTKTDRHFGLGSTRVIRSHPLRVTSWMALLDGFWGFVLFSALTIGLKAGRHWLLTRGHWRDVCFDCMLRLLTMVHNYCLSYSSCLLNCSYIL